MLYNILLVVIIIIWSIDPFIQKGILKSIDFNDYLVISSINSIIITSIYLYSKKYTFHNIKKIEKNTLLKLLCYSILSTIAYFSYLYVITEKPISVSNPILNPMTLILTAIIGIFIAKESLTKYQIFGTIIIIIGTIAFFIK